MPRTTAGWLTSPVTQAVWEQAQRANALFDAHRDDPEFGYRRKFVHAIHRHGLAGSMGCVGAAGGNAAMESFFALLQKNVLDRQAWRVREELRIAIVTWTERTYYRRR